LRRALETRDTIGQAKGILMERFNTDAKRAFEILVKLSQESNTRVADLAHKLVDMEHPPREP
jgi:AmiR/NasT family two-component response regulator